MSENRFCLLGWAVQRAQEQLKDVKVPEPQEPRTLRDLKELLDRMPEGELDRKVIIPGYDDFSFWWDGTLTETEIKGETCAEFSPGDDTGV